MIALLTIDWNYDQNYLMWPNRIESIRLSIDQWRGNEAQQKNPSRENTSDERAFSIQEEWVQLHSKPTCD